MGWICGRYVQLLICGRVRNQETSGQYQDGDNVKGHSIQLYLCFVDYTKTFDCAKQMMKEELSHLSLYRDQESAVQTSVGLTIGRGVR